MADIKLISSLKEVDEASITRLEKALVLAKEGNLYCAMIIGRDKAHNTYCSWSPSDDLFRDLAQATRLQYHIQKRLDLNENDN
ncbi:MAG: hypothetical protein ACREAE_07515 [Nitrosopumilaceae archaeon]